MSRPRLLDLFCGAGGAAVGYHRAGFDIIGVDINPQPHYPFEFHQVDAMWVLGLYNGGLRPRCLSDLTAIHASPPCQALTNMSNRWRGKGGKADSHVDLIAPTRDLLIKTGLPYVIENVVGASKKMIDPIILRGGMFGLGVDRPRLFESNVLLSVPSRTFKILDPVGVYGAMDGRLLYRRKDGSEQHAARCLEEAQEAMGIDWMDWDHLKESIPPSYTEWIGKQLL